MPLDDASSRLTTFNTFQQGYGDVEDSDDIERSQESESSQSSEEMESSQEEEEHRIDPWSRIHDDASDRHGAQLEALTKEYAEQNGYSSEVAHI